MTGQYMAAAQKGLCNMPLYVLLISWAAAQNYLGLFSLSLTFSTFFCKSNKVESWKVSHIFKWNFFDALT